MLLKWWEIVICCLFGACLLIALFIFTIPHPVFGEHQYYATEMTCSGTNFVYIARNYSNPITPDEILAWKTHIDQNVVRSGGKKPAFGISSKGGAGCSGDCDPRDVAFGFYIDEEGVPHEMGSGTGNQGRRILCPV